jgi:N-acetylmuramoyl-L-alanine amidase
MKVAISSGHGSQIRGASGIIDEVNEARRVTEKVADILQDSRHRAMVSIFHDDTSTTQGENLETIADWHNSTDRAIDVSVHFNAYEPTESPMGTETLWVTQDDLAEAMSEAIAEAGGFINRGPKKRTDLYFLNNTDKPAILIEVCFVDSESDVELYERNFNVICEAIADVLADGEALVA